jgi:prolyl 4-hydroxylase
MVQQTVSAVSEPSAEVAKAEEYDRAGRHTEAIDRLAAGARQGDVEALTRLGKRLLVGDRAPHLASDGARFIADASARGGAEAAAVLAVLLALGVSRQQSLDAALASLVAAAERGWLTAQSQLRVLAKHRESASTSSAETPPPWRQLAASIDLHSWTSAAPGTDLNESPRIRLFADFVSRDVGRWLIGRAEGRLSRALVYEALRKEVTVHPTRTNTAASFNILETDLVCVATQLRMAASLGVSFRQFEPITVLHYAEGEEITEHFDFVDPLVPDYEQEIARKGQRIATFLVYLNDDYSGGETDFPRAGVTHKGRAGEGLVFINSLPDGSADVRTLHAGRPPRAGEKWIVSQFVRNRPVF